MGFSIDSFNRTLKNRTIRTSNKDGFKSKNRDVSIGSSKKKMLNFKEVSEEELERIKQNIRDKGKKRRLRIIVFTLIFTLIISCGIYYILYEVMT